MGIFMSIMSTLKITTMVLLMGCVASAFADDYASKKGLQGYHISSLIKQWGQPTSQKGNRYNWKECTYTGYVISQCQYGTCRSHKETTCCGQHVTTDKDGVITGYRESGEGYCFNSVNYATLSQERRYAKQMYGFLGVSEKNGNYHAPYSIQADKALAQNHVHQDCGGKCSKVYEFHNSCIADAVPKGMKVVPISNYYVAVHKDLAKAQQNALKQCEKVHGKGGCEQPIWDTKKAGACAMDYR